MLCCVDQDVNKLNKVKTIWNVKYTFYSIRSLLESKISLDVVSICTPIEEHYSNIKQIVKLSPKVIFCEKPIGKDIKDSRDILKICSDHNIKLVVNYIRRWDSELQDFKSNLNANKFGKLRSIDIKFNNGILNYGSHVFDTLLFIFDDNYNKFKTIKLLDEDMYYDMFKLFYDKLPIYVTIEKTDDFSLLEIKFNFFDKQIMMLNGGRDWSYRKIVKDTNFRDNYIYSKIKFKKGNVIETLPKAILEIQNILDFNYDSKSNGKTAFQSQLLCDKILKIFKKNGK